MRLLAKYPVVRGRDAVGVGDRPQRSPRLLGAGHASEAGASAARATTTASSSSSSSSSSSAAPASSLSAASAATATASSSSLSPSSPALPVPPKDFWAGLSSFLEAHYGAQAAKAVASKFDEAHYRSLRALNYEDIEDVAALFAREAAAVAAASGHQGPGQEGEAL
jgi:hypothetical protein